jgi:toluene monooxygenase system protein E
MTEWPRKHKPPSRLKTYTHLAGERRIPTEYEIATTHLLYYAGKGFEVRMPASGWYERFQQRSALRCANWEAFADPRRLTYSAYVKIRRASEAHLDGILRTIDDAGYDRGLDADWVRVLSRTMAPLRYPLHALQMVAAYVGSMAPTGRLTVVALFQAGDTMRLVQRLAYRMIQLRQTIPEFGIDAAARWQNDPMWQPLRRLVEELLVTYDFGEALVALNICVKPALDHFFMVRLAEEARRRGDPQYQAFCASFWDDFAWQHEWTAAVLDCACSQRPQCREPVDRWSMDWGGRVAAALAPFSLGGLSPEQSRANPPSGAAVQGGGS